MGIRLVLLLSLLTYSNAVYSQQVIGDEVDSLEIRIKDANDLIKKRLDSLNAIRLLVNNHLTKNVSSLGKTMTDSIAQIRDSVSHRIQGLKALAERTEKVIDSIKSEFPGPRLPHMEKLRSITEEVREVSANVEVDPASKITLPQSLLPNSIESDLFGAQKNIPNLPEFSGSGKDLVGFEVNGLMFDSARFKHTNLAGALEGIVAEQSEVQDVIVMQADAMNQVKTYGDLIRQYESEKKIQEEIEAKMVDIANDVILEKKEVISASLKRMRKVTRRYSDVTDLRNLPLKTVNPLKGMKLRERTTLQLGLKTIKSNRSGIQFEPAVVYRLNPMIAVGAGGIYRTGFDFDNLQFNSLGQMHGGKVTVRTVLHKNTYLFGEGQTITYKFLNIGTHDRISSERNNILLLGIGQNRRFSKTINGLAEAVFNWESKPGMVYNAKVMFRFGFEFSIKKRELKTWQLRLRDYRKCFREGKLNF